MKILIPSYDFKPMLGGVANYVHEVASLLSTAHGAQVTVIARHHDHAKDFDAKVPYKVVRISSPTSAFASQLPFIIKNLTESAFYDRILCPLWFPDAASVWWSQKLSLITIPTYIVVHASEIFDVQNSIKTQIRHALVSPLQRPVFHSAKGIFAVSSYTGNIIHQKLAIPKEKIHVINNGVNLKLFSPPTTPSTSTQLRLLTVSRLFPYKGIDTVLKSLAHLKKSTSNFHYTVVGSGPDRARLEKLSHELQIADHVTFTGALEKEQILEKYQNTDLFIMMSRYEHPDVEGFGLVFLEAAACGVASIGGNSGGIPDAIENEKTGWLLDPTDSVLLSEKLLELVSHPQIAKTMGSAALKSVQNKDWQHTVQKMWDILQ